MLKKSKKDTSILKYFKTAFPVTVAIAIILAAGGYIVFRLMSEKQYNERWKDYDECGI